MPPCCDSDFLFNCAGWVYGVLPRNTKERFSASTLFFDGLSCHNDTDGDSRVASC